MLTLSIIFSHFSSARAMESDGRVSFSTGAVLVGAAAVVVNTVRATTAASRDECTEDSLTDSDSKRKHVDISKMILSLNYLLIMMSLLVEFLRR